MDIQKEIVDLKKRVELLERKLDKFDSDPECGFVTRKKLAIKEFILSKKSHDDTQKTLLIAYFLEKDSSSTTFNVDDISQGFQDAKEKAPKNINDRINSLIRKGWVMKAKEKKDNKIAWILTNTGEGIVENGFPKK